MPRTVSVVPSSTLERRNWRRFIRLYMLILFKNGRAKGLI
jgi:hypothetical protein